MSKRSVIVCLVLIICSGIEGYADEYDDMIGKATSIYLASPDEAKALIDKAAILQPARGEAYVMSGVVNYTFGGDTAESGALFKKGVTLMKDSKDKPNYIRMIDWATSQFKSDKELNYFKSAYAAVNGNNPGLAVELIEKALLENKKNFKLYYEIGYACIDLRQIGKAIQYLEEARKINPVNKGVLTELMFSYSDTGNIDMLNGIIKDLRDFHGDQPQLNQELAYTYRSLKKDDMAIDALEKNIAAFPDFYASYYMLAQLYFAAKNYHKAKPLLETLRVNIKEGDFTKSNISYKEALQKMNDMYDFIQNLKKQ